MKSYDNELMNHDLSRIIIIVLFISGLLVFHNKRNQTTELENYSLELNKIVEHSQPALNIVQEEIKVNEPELKTLIYNRVPKCGSTTMTKTLELLQHKNPTLFELKDYVIPREKHYFRNDTSDYYDFVNAIKHNSYSNLLYIRHFYHQYETDIKYINFIRHPVEHFISWFYWERKINSGRWKHIVESGTEKLSIDECIDSGIFETCKHPGRYTEYLSYLCGQEWFCLDKFGEIDENSGKFRKEKSDELKLKALEQAKSNIERDYLVVGVLELIEESLDVFAENVAWFSGIKEAYHVIENSKGKRMMSSGKIQPSDKAKQYLTEKLTFEIQLYEFAVNKLESQYRSLNKHKEV